MNLKSWIHAHGRITAIFHDILIIPLAWFGAYWLRFNLDGIPPESFDAAISMLPVVMGIQTLAFWSFGLYRGIWQFASLPDLLRIIKAVLMGCGFSLLTIFLMTRMQGMPRSVLPIYGMLLILMLGGPRFLVRWVKEFQRHRRLSGQRVLVIGAGRSGESLVRELLRDISLARQYKPVAFVDDKKSKQGQEIHGIRVVGQCKDIPKIVKDYEIELIVIAIPSARSPDLRHIISHCEGSGCKVRTLPGLNYLVEGRVSVDLLRDISLEDLLGRDPVHLDWAGIRRSIENHVVLVTGGGGSIGSELCRQVIRLKPAQLIVVEHSEFNLFNLEQEFLEKFSECPLALHLVNVGDRAAMNQILEKHKPHIIFHAAAYKHVPMLESQPREAILNNILGTRCLAQLAIAHQVQKVVLVSTDKAVNPTNVMGASKRGSEMVCHHYNEVGSTEFITVRFGNVLGSAGSVVPIFKAQLEKGGPITVTHPDVMRYFMTIPEACQLILQALAIGKGGEIYVLDMGEPIKIQFLAEQMIQLAGKKPGIDIEIRYTGLRPGEKLFEELFHPSEILGKTEHEKILRANIRAVDSLRLTQLLDALEEACNRYNDEELRILLHQLVPEFVVSVKTETSEKLGSVAVASVVEY